VVTARLPHILRSDALDNRATSPATRVAASRRFAAFAIQAFQARTS